MASQRLPAEVENLNLINFDLNRTGNASDNANAGSVENNVIDSAAASDTLPGGEGNDTLLAGLGNHQLDGGLGVDVISPLHSWRQARCYPRAATKPACRIFFVPHLDMRG